MFRIAVYTIIHVPFVHRKNTLVQKNLQDKVDSNSTREKGMDKIDEGASYIHN